MQLTEVQFSSIHWHNSFTASTSKLPVLLKKVEKIFLDGTFLDVIRQIVCKTKKYTCKGVLIMNMKKIGVSIMVASILIGGAYTVSSNARISNAMLLDSEKSVAIQLVDENKIAVKPQVDENEIAICYAEPSSFEMYHKAIGYIMDLDSGLNTDMEYIAVEYKYEFSDADKQDITKALESYGVKVFESNLEELAGTQYSDEYGNLYGILITFKDVEVSENVTSISFTKYKSGKGAISTAVTLIQKDNGEWEVKKVDTPMIAS